MKKSTPIFSTLLALLLFVSCQPKSMDQIHPTPDEKKSVKRVGMVIKIKPDQIEAYKELHADGNAGVRDLLTKYNMRNFSIFLHQLDDGNYYEFGYYEYVGDDFEKDMELLSQEPRNKEWLSICDPMQVPLEGYDGWAEMEKVYFNK